MPLALRTICYARQQRWCGEDAREPTPEDRPRAQLCQQTRRAGVCAANVGFAVATRYAATVIMNGNVNFLMWAAKRHRRARFATARTRHGRSIQGSRVLPRQRPGGAAVCMAMAGEE